MGYSIFKGNGASGHLPGMEDNDQLAVRAVVEFDSNSGEGGSEVVSYDNGKVYTTNGAAGRIDIFDAGTGARIGDIDLTGIQGYDGVQSVSVHDGIVAAAIDIADAPLAGDPMLVPQVDGWTAAPLITVGASLDNGYAPVGVFDGIGAIELDAETVRIFVNQELGSGVGASYDVNGIELTGARISFFDIDKDSRSITDGGIAIKAIYDASGSLATDTSFTFEDKPGFERFCSGSLFEADNFGSGHGLADNIYFAGEETGGAFSGTGGAEWALDIATGDLWAVPALGRGAWENVTELDTGTSTHVAFLLSDDTSPFDADGDGVKEAAPMFLYVGEKDATGNFLERNGLADGKLYVWVSDTGEMNPADFNGSGSLAGHWAGLDTTPDPALADEYGVNGYDEWGNPTQKNLWSQAEALGAFGFSRPEDATTNPADGTIAAFTSTGRGSDFGGADQVGTIYTMAFDFSDINAPTAVTTIVYDGDADPAQALRSPDNIDWADDGYLYIQEDQAVSGLFGGSAINPNEAGIVRIDPATGTVERLFNIDQTAISPYGAIENGGPANVGEWESSGILDVSSLFGEAPGTLFLADVQAHGLGDQTGDGPAGRLNDGDLVEGGQLLFLAAPGTDNTVENPLWPTGPQNGLVALFDSAGNPLGDVEVGNLPDMLTFSEDGTRIFVANEGEPGDGQDPAGSISIIDVATMTAKTFGFEAFDAQVDALRDAGVRIFPDTLPSTDFEPEYIAEDATNGKLYITLQETNAVAVFDLASESYTGIIPLGVVDHSKPGFELDVSDKDGAINIANWPVFGLRMPDAIAAHDIGGETFLFTANEGDSRNEDARVKDLVLDPTAFPDAATLQEDENLGRLTVSTIDGDTDGDGDYDALYAYGSRSFTIFDSDGNVVFDSGSDFEKIIAANRPANAFNNDDYPSGAAGDVDENRSDNKGPEPEAIAVGEVGDKVIAAIGLERDSGIMLYDVTDPANARFLQYIDCQADGNVSPEVIRFLDGDESPTGKPSLAVAFEVSGTTAIYELTFGKEITDAAGRSSKLVGDFGNDVISGLNGRDELHGLDGDDQLYGGNGRDLLVGGEGDDTLDGGNGADIIVVGPGNDLVTGGHGPDTFRFVDGIGEATITDFDHNDRIALNGVSIDQVSDTIDGTLVTLSDGGMVLLAEVHLSGHAPGWVDFDAFV